MSIESTSINELIHHRFFLSRSNKRWWNKTFVRTELHGEEDLLNRSERNVIHSSKLNLMTSTISLIDSSIFKDLINLSLYSFVYSMNWDQRMDFLLIRCTKKVIDIHVDVHPFTINDRRQGWNAHWLVFM